MSSTDVLRAERILVDDRIYRILPIKESLKITDVKKPIRSNTYLDENDENFDLPITHQGDRFIATIHVPSSLIGIVVGFQHKNINALNQQYGTKISIPDAKNVEAGIIIQGSTRKSVSLTYCSIQNKVNYGRMKTDSTHFISFPVNFPNIQESFLKFKDDVLKKYKRVRGIDASIFQKPTKLHVTVAVLVLLDGRDKENATAILNKCTDTALKELGGKEIAVQVKGLEIMNDDPSEVDVLYAKLHELNDDNRLQILADKIMKDFVAANLCNTLQTEVKLHITLMNTIFRNSLESEDSEVRITFDASQILKDYVDYNFGEIIISEIHISIRYTEALDGYYNCIHKMKL